MSAMTDAVAAPIQPLHNAAQAAHVAVPQAPLGNATNGTAMATYSTGAKALLAKKMAKNSNPSFGVSPTDNLMTPCTQKISAAKKKHFGKGKPMRQLFAHKESALSQSGDEQQKDEDENPF